MYPLLHSSSKSESIIVPCQNNGIDNGLFYKYEKYILNSLKYYNFDDISLIISFSFLYI